MSVGRSWCLNGGFFFMVRTGVAARAMILSLVYDKVVKLKNAGDRSLGEVTDFFMFQVPGKIQAEHFGTLWTSSYKL